MKTLARETLVGLVIVTMIYIISYRWIDIPLMYSIYLASMNSDFTVLAVGISAIFSPACWVFAGLAALGSMLVFHKKISVRTAEALFRFGLAILVTEVLVTFLKIIIGRYRPEMLLNENQYGFHFFSLYDGDHSSPSGHAALSFCGFYMLSRFFKKRGLTLLLLLAGCAVCIARLILAKHYLSDVIFGGYLGILTVLWTDALLNWTRSKWYPYVKAA